MHEHLPLEEFHGIGLGLTAMAGMNEAKATPDDGFRDRLKGIISRYSPGSILIFLNVVQTLFFQVLGTLGSSEFPGWDITIMSPLIT